MDQGIVWNIYSSCICKFYLGYSEIDFCASFYKYFRDKGEKNMAFCLLPKWWKGIMINIPELSKGVLERFVSCWYKNPTPHKSVQFWSAVCFQRSLGICAILMSTWQICIKSNNWNLSHLHASLTTDSLRLNFSSCHGSCAVLSLCRETTLGGWWAEEKVFIQDWFFKNNIN